MNLPNIQYFNYKPAYTGLPLQETEQYLKAIADEYTVTRDSYDALQIAMAQQKSTSKSEQDYLDTVKNSVTESLKKVAKDTQGNIRFEQANQVVRNMAVKFATDETILAIKDRYIAKELAEKKRLDLAAEGVAPIGFNIDDGEGLTYDEKGKPVVKKYTGWYEPQGAYTKGYTDIVDKLSMDDRKMLRDLQNKKTKGILTPEEQKSYTNITESLYQKVPQLAETNQDFRQLKSKGYSDEDAKKFIIENRLSPIISEQSEIERKVEYQDEILQNQLEKQEAASALAEKRQDRRLEEQYRKKLQFALATGKIKEDGKGGYIPVNGDTTGSGQADILFSEVEGGIQSTNNTSTKIDEKAFDINGNVKSDYNFSKVVTKEEYLKNKDKYSIVSTNSVLGGITTYTVEDKFLKDKKEITQNISNQKDYLIKVGYPNAQNLRPKEVANIYNNAVVTDQNRVQNLTIIASGDIISELQKSGFIYSKPSQLPLGQAGIMVMGENGDSKTLQQRKITVDDKADDLEFRGFTKSGNEKEGIRAGSAVYNLKKGTGELYRIAIPPNLIDTNIEKGYAITDAVTKVFNKTPISNDDKTFNEKYSIKPSQLGFSLTLDKDVRFMSIKSINENGQIESELVPFIYDDDTGVKKYVNIESIPDNQDFLNKLKQTLTAQFGDYKLSFSDLEKRNEAVLLKNPRIQGAIRSRKALESQMGGIQNKTVEQIVNEE